MTIRQEVSFECSPTRLYGLLLSSAEFAAATGAAAEIDASPGGNFSCFDDQITGQTTRLVEDREIVQHWRVGNWPEGQHSTVRFSLEAEAGKTRLTMEQSGHPEDATPHLEGGWHKMYWQPLRDYLAE